MSKESDLQSKIIGYLKGKGCYVVKTRPGPGTPVGCPDIVFMLEGFWGGIEVKASKTSPYQPLQKETIEKFERWSYGRVCYPENWPEIYTELESIL